LGNAENNHEYTAEAETIGQKGRQRKEKKKKYSGTKRHLNCAASVARHREKDA
jgi:hypothetical protein